MADWPISHWALLPTVRSIKTLRRFDQALRLFLYTDGLIEAPNPDGCLFGQQTLIQLLEDDWDASVVDLKNRVRRAFTQHTGGQWSHDDVTFMGLEIV